MADRRVAREQVLAFRARAHALDERRSTRQVGDVVCRAGIQDTPPGNADVALAARLDIDAPFAADAVAKKRLVCTWSLRGAPHVLAPADFALFTLGACPADAASFQTLGMLAKHDQLDPVEKAMMAALAGKPKAKGEVSATVTATVPRELSPWCRGCNVHHPSDTVFRAAPLLGRIVLTSTSPVMLTRAKSWLGADATGSVVALRTELLLRYLRCYAPTTAAHFAEWAGIGRADAKQRWAAVADALVPVAAGKKAFVLEEDLDALEHAEPVNGVRLLPSKDVYLQARDRDLLLPDKAQRTSVFTILGGPGVVLVDGAPAATWRGKGRVARYEITVQPLRKLTKREEAEIGNEAQRVAHVRGHEEALTRTVPS